MRIRKVAICAVTLAASASVAGHAQNVTIPERLQAMQFRMAHLKQEAIYKIPPAQRGFLSGGARNLLQLSETWDRIQGSLTMAATNPMKLSAIETALQSSRIAEMPSMSSGPVRVSNPDRDFLFSVLTGFTQSETSTAWCGSNVVVGFNDSGSLFESLLFGPGGLSGVGVSVSGDKGQSFRDLGFVNPGSDPGTFLQSDPVLNCTDANTFYFSNVGSTVLQGFEAFVSTVNISKSTDGGHTWQDPVFAVEKDASLDFLDKDWSAVDPHNPNNIYVTYTDFGFGTPFCQDIAPERIAIEIVHSEDGGVTWSDPTVLDQVCNSTVTVAPSVQASQVVVDSHGTVFVEWEQFQILDFRSQPARVLSVARSTDHGASFQNFSKIALASPTGDGNDLQGNFRDSITGSLAVDRSGTKTDGYLYLTWDDGRLLSNSDLGSPTGLYQYSSVLISRSTDRGKTWSAPVRVNNDPIKLERASDHFQPGVAVDGTGALAVCWYDRRDDPLNFKIERYCGFSSDHGLTWTNQRVDPHQWEPFHNGDILAAPDYLGDYDTVASESDKKSAGFLGAYARVTRSNVPVPNQDVFLVQVK